jgi:hypothetical protein
MTDLNSSRLPLLENIINRMVSDETKIFRTSLYFAGFWFELFAREVEVQLLVAELQCVARMVSNRIGSMDDCLLTVPRYWT